MESRLVAATASGVVIGFVLSQALSRGKHKASARKDSLQQQPPPLVNNATQKKVLVSGCYDLLHSGHVEFFNTAATYGDVYVCVGKDDTIEQLKGKPPMFPQEERLLMVKSLKSVFHAELEEEGGLFGFTPNLRRIKPDFFVVNHDSSGIDHKRALCAQEGIEFVLLPRKPPVGCPPRSSTAIKSLLKQAKDEGKTDSSSAVAVLAEISRVTAREIRFFQKALVYGTELHVLLYSETESDAADDDCLVVLKSLSIVKKVHRIGKDWRAALQANQRPNVLVERAGSPLLPEIRQLCSEAKVKLMVVDDEEGSAWEQEPPFRICLAGGWMDQPWVSSLALGSVVVVNVFPHSFKERSGMATSSRKLWQGTLWDNRVYKHAPEQLAKLLFGYENPPGCAYVSGSQDHLGLCLPGISRLIYDGHHWPRQVSRLTDAASAAWLESVLLLLKLEERSSDYNPLEQKNLTKEGVARLGAAGDLCWEAIVEKNIVKLGAALSATHKAWKELLPLTTNAQIDELCKNYASQEGVFGQITSGAGGGYLILVTEKAIAGGFRIRVRNTWDGEHV